MKNQKTKPRQVKYGFNIPEKIKGPISFGFSSSGQNDFKSYFTTLDGEKYPLEPFTRDVVYEGINKDKVILSQPITESGDILNKEKSYVLEFDLIVVIDTNYKIIEQEKYASSCWIVCEKDKSEMVENGYAMTTYEYNWVATNEEKPENIMYANVINKIEKHRVNNDLNSKIAVIIDSDLDKINDFNNRKMPIYADFYLPEAFTVIYANSERGTTEYIKNKLMQMCDKEGKESLKDFIETKMCEEAK